MIIKFLIISPPSSISMLTSLIRETTLRYLTRIKIRRLFLEGVLIIWRCYVLRKLLILLIFYKPPVIALSLILIILLDLVDNRSLLISLGLLIILILLVVEYWLGLYNNLTFFVNLVCVFHFYNKLLLYNLHNQLITNINLKFHY